MELNTERYHRQVILKDFGEESQQKLAEASVLVIGAGGLGCPSLLYLAAAGVGRIGLIDSDVVCLSNLHRQVLFSTDDIGMLKVEVAAKKLTELNPEISITPYPFFITQSNILNIIKAYDFIVDGTDNFESRYLINDACVMLNKPLIFAAVSGYEGQLAVFNIEDENGIKTNYRDIFPVSPETGEIQNCAENGVIGVLPGLIGTMQAAETIKLITGIGKPLINKILNYNLLQQSFYEIEVTTAPEGSYHIPLSESAFQSPDLGYPVDKNPDWVLEIDINELRDLQKKNPTILIDVREVHEVPKLNAVIYKQFPLSNFEALLDQEIAEKNIILFCQHGIRSLSAVEILREKYGTSKNIYSLKGGIVYRENYLNLNYDGKES